MGVGIGAELVPTGELLAARLIAKERRHRCSLPFLLPHSGEAAGPEAVRLADLVLAIRLRACGAVQKSLEVGANQRLAAGILHVCEELLQVLALDLLQAPSLGLCRGRLQLEENGADIELLLFSTRFISLEHNLVTKLNFMSSLDFMVMAFLRGLGLKGARTTGGELSEKARQVKILSPWREAWRLAGGS